MSARFDPDRKVTIFDKLISLGNYLTNARLRYESKEEIQKGSSYLRQQLGLPSLNGFPEILNPNSIADQWANVYASYLESPPQFFYMAFLTCLGLILSDRITLKSEIRPEPRLYTVLLGESALTRKSTAIDLTVDFFREHVTDWAECRGVGSAEGLEDRLKANKNLLLVIDELKAFVGKCKIEGRVLLPCVTTLFESNRYEAHTRSHKISLNDIHLGLLGAATTETYETMWNSAFIDIGLLNRLFLVPGNAERRFSLPRIIPSEMKEYFSKAIKTVLQFANMKQEYTLTTRAEELYEMWYISLENSVHIRRLDTYATRFMPLLAVCEFKEEIDADLTERVTTLMNWQLEMRRELDPVDADNAVARMEEKIRRILTSGDKTDRDLRRATHADRAGLWVFSAAKRNLRQAGEIKYSAKNKCFSLVKE